jgi:PhnB protein
MAKAARAVPEGYHTITPQLTLNDAAKMIDWYKQALGAKELSRSAGPDGKIMHAELQIGDSRVMVNDPMPGTKGPKELGGSPTTMWLYVEDCDAVFTKAVAAGAKAQMPVDNQFWGDRGGAFTDPNGYTWWIATRKEDLTRAELDQRAQDFFKQMAQPTSR